ncbi:MAG: hypothetical protein JSU07_04060 [Bacteroidetes bacterium]|nr:hypothetical protein [Bacteroidota bacterium]
MKKISVIILVLSIFSYCKSKKTSTSTPAVKATAINVPSDKELAVAKKIWPTATIDELNEGHKIFYNQCTQCHQAFNIPGFSERKWKHEIDDMSPKAQLTAEQKDKLTKYILSFREANTPAKTN